MGINVDQKRTAQERGVWTSFGGSKFKVVHSGSIKFQRTLNRLQQPYRRKIDKGSLDPEVSRKILCEAMATGILLDWKDVVDGQGQEVPFSSDVAEKALLNNDDLREYIQDFAMDLENYRAEEIVETGNS